jgi:hypothetical protein
MPCGDISARMKLMELTHLYLLWMELKTTKRSPENILGQGPEDFMESLRVPCLCWFATLVDKSKDGLDILELWKILFPKHRKKVEALWRKIEPSWSIIRDFRDRAGFHADKPQRYWDAQVTILRNSKAVIKALQEFLNLAILLLKEEAEALPDFEGEIDHVLLDVELRHKDFRIANRQKLKRMFGLPIAQKYRRVF